MADRPTASLSLRARVALPALIALLAALSVYRLYVAPHPGPHVEFAGPTMGTTYMVKVASEDLDAPTQRVVAGAIQAELERVNSLMSTYIEDSEISRFNRHRSLAAFPVSAETAEVFDLARQVSEESDGAFDATVAPLVRAWGFGSNGAEQTPPSASELAALDGIVGHRNLVVDRAGASLQKRVLELECDLSAVAKGYAVDRVSLALSALGFSNTLVEIGGELRASGRRADGRVWRVAIERPDPTQRAVHQIIGLEDLSLATSGDYRNFYELNGERISHTIDPRTRRPITHELASVSVVHASAARADALATALNVLGPDAGHRLALELDIAAMFIVRRAGDGDAQNSIFETRLTPAFERIVAISDRANPQS